MTTVLEQAMQLSSEAKLDLISRLWDALAESSDPLPMPNWQREELQRRIDSQQTDPQPGQSWDEIKREIVDGQA